MKILVLGATGQIGHALTWALARAGHSVTAMVRKTGGLRFPEGVKLIERPVFDADAFDAALREAEHVVHALGLPEQFLFDDSAFHDVNCRLLDVFLEAMARSNVRRLSYLSTYEVFALRDGVMRESHPLADESVMTPYSRSKLRAYKRVTEFAARHHIQLASIHPAAAYGGLATGDGVTTFMENLIRWRMHRVPMISRGDFPVIHVDSLCDLVLKTLDRSGPFIASDQMTSLPGIAQTLRRFAPSYSPLVAPLSVVKAGVVVMEAAAKVAPIKPLTSDVQLKFITRGWRPDAAKAKAELGWSPMSLDEGCARLVAKLARADESEPQAAPVIALDAKRAA